MTDNLLPCPFCGGEAEMRESSTHDFYAKCAGCGASTRRNHENRNGAVIDWNTRAERTCETCAYKRLDKYGGKAVWVEEDEVLCMLQPSGECEYYRPKCGAKVVS